MTEDPADQAVALLLEVMQDPGLEARYLQGVLPLVTEVKTGRTWAETPLSQGPAAGCRNALQQKAPAVAMASKATHRRIAISVFDAALGLNPEDLRSDDFTRGTEP